MTNQSDNAPSREEFIEAAVRWARITAGLEWDQKYGNPSRARAEAQAWLSIIKLHTMGPSSQYKTNSRSRPKTAVVPVALGVTLTQLGFDVTYCSAGSPFRFNSRHADRIKNLFGGNVSVEQVPGHQYTRQITLPENRILVTWHMQGAPLYTSDPDTYPPSFNVFLLRPDGTEQETRRVTCRIVSAHLTEQDASDWVSQRLTDFGHSS